MDTECLLSKIPFSYSFSRLERCCRANIQENIDLIRLQREVREKSSCLTQLEQNYSNLQEVKTAHDSFHQLIVSTSRSVCMECSGTRYLQFCSCDPVIINSGSFLQLIIICPSFLTLKGAADHDS